MFSFFKINPTKRLKKRYAMLLEQAMHAQRNGDIRTYSRLTAEADEMYQHIKQVESAESER